MGIKRTTVGGVAVTWGQRQGWGARSVHETVLTSDTRCEFGRCFKSFAERLTKLTGSPYAHSYDLLQGKGRD